MRADYCGFLLLGHLMESGCVPVFWQDCRTRREDKAVFDGMENSSRGPKLEDHKPVLSQKVAHSLFYREIRHKRLSNVLVFSIMRGGCLAIGRHANCIANI